MLQHCTDKMIVEFAKKLFVPSLWEIQVSFAAAAFIICVYCFFSCLAGVDCAADHRKVIGDSEASGDAQDDNKKFCTYFVDRPAERRKSVQFCI